MTVPLMVLAVLSVFGGMLNLPEMIHANPQWMAEWLRPVIVSHEGGHHEALSASMEMTLMGLTTALVLVSLVICWVIYVQRKMLPVPDSQLTGISKVLANKFYVDELYDTVIVKPMELFSTLLHKLFDKAILDGIVNNIGNGIMGAGNYLRRLQTGAVEFYFFGMVTGIILLTSFLILILYKNL
jgi:NADH-quinone oxidoreductase subunit L